jgi:hypothetical protein
MHTHTRCSHAKPMYSACEHLSQLVLNCLQACLLQPSSATPNQAISVRRVRQQHTGMQGFSPHACACSQIECQCQDWVHSVRSLPHGETGFVLLATEGGLQIWDKPGHHLVFLWTFPGPESSITSSGSSPAAQQACALHDCQARNGLIVLLSACGSCFLVAGSHR